VRKASTAYATRLLSRRTEVTDRPAKLLSLRTEVTSKPPRRTIHLTRHSRGRIARRALFLEAEEYE
jgi:hypothetical protein